MAFTEQDAQADIASYQPPADKNAAPHPLATPAGTPPDPIQAAQVPPPGPTTPSYLDGVVSFVDKYKSRVGDIFDAVTATNPQFRGMRNYATGAIKGAVNVADSAKSLLTAGPAVSETADENGSLTATEDKAPAPDPFHPIYDDARKAILGVRDAIAVKDPTLMDGLISGFGQFAGPWAAYSRILGSLGWAARAASIPEAGASFGARILAKGVDTVKSLPRLAAVDAAVNATANAPHDPRTADLFSLHNTAEGKFHDMLNTVSPDGSLVRHYIDYVANPDGSEAENRWKNVLDGFNVGAAVGGVFHVAAGTFRAGWGALGYMADNNMGSMGDLMPSPQAGHIANMPAKSSDGVGPITSAAFPSTSASAEDIAAGQKQNRNVINMLRDAAQKYNAKGVADPDGVINSGGIPVHQVLTQLNEGLSRATPQGAFYGEIFDRLQSKNLQTSMLPSALGVHSTSARSGAFGSYSPAFDTMAIHQPALEGNNQTLLHTIAHEAVHAATINAVENEPTVKAALKSIFEDAEKSPAVQKLAEGDRYGISRTPSSNAPMVHELTAEAEANPRFRQALKDTPSERGGSLWDNYKRTIGGILGVSGAMMMSPQFDKLLTKGNDGA